MHELIKRSNIFRAGCMNSNYFKCIIIYFVLLGTDSKCIANPSLPIQLLPDHNIKRFNKNFL